MRGHVIDYLDFHVGGWHWPAFNLADMAIFAGVLALVLASTRRDASRYAQGAI